MYLKNASLDHLPINMIVYTGISSRYMAIAAPEWSECVPISSGWKPNRAAPIDAAAPRTACLMSIPETWYVRPFEWNVFTVQFGDAPGILLTCWTIFAHATTGQRIRSHALCIVIVSIRSPFFWFMNVMAT